MARRSCSPLLRSLLAASLLMAVVLPGALAGLPEQLVAGWFPTRAACTGTLAECLAGEEGEEFALDSGSSHRILQSTRGYISYGALQPGTVPCSLGGASYYNCRPGSQVNPYTRPCTTITRCRS